MTDYTRAPGRPRAHLASPSMLHRAWLALILGLSLTSPAAAAATTPADKCKGQISYRLWQEAGEKLVAYGGDVEVLSGQQAHLYIQVAGQEATGAAGQTKAGGTSATIGYPGEFGFGGTAKEVLRHVRMEAQNAADRQYGRIRFSTLAEGGTYLGYRIDTVDPPNQLSRVPEPCRVGQVMIHVVAPQQIPADVEPTIIAPREAAEQLVVLLYYGLLRRRIVDQFDSGYVEMVLLKGRVGIAEVAKTIFQSNEFRESALRRAEERHGAPKRGTTPLPELLLGDLYSALYGRSRPTKNELRADLEDLEICLKGHPRYIETCGRLGAQLVNHPFFYDHNKDLIEALKPKQEDGAG